MARPSATHVKVWKNFNEMLENPKLPVNMRFQILNLMQQYEVQKLERLEAQKQRRFRIRLAELRAIDVEEPPNAGNEVPNANDAADAARKFLNDLKSKQPQTGNSNN